MATQMSQFDRAIFIINVKSVENLKYFHIFASVANSTIMMIQMYAAIQAHSRVNPISPSGSTSSPKV